MKPSTKDQIKGKLHEVKGKVKEKAGQVTNNPELEAEGQAENLDGKIQKKVGQIKKVFGKSMIFCGFLYKGRMRLKQPRAVSSTLNAPSSSCSSGPGINPGAQSGW